MYEELLVKSLGLVEVWLKSDKCNIHFTWRPRVHLW